MLSRSRLLLASIVLAVAAAAHAAPRTTLPEDGTRAERLVAAQARQGALSSRAMRPKSTEAVNFSTPVLPIANAARAYPPSCLADPLPDQTLGPVFSRSVNLSAFDRNNPSSPLLEGVTIKIWRVACSSSTFFTAATMMRIERQSQFNGDNVIYPLFPAITISQGSIDFNETDASNLIRVATEPNTVISDVLVGTPIVYSTTFVLESYPYIDTTIFDFNLPFALQFDNLATGGPNDLFVLSVPSYSPTSSTYPAAFQDLPISGYMSTNWFDPAASGEGITLVVYEPINDSQNLIVNYTWQAYDGAGIPFWLVGQTTIARGAKVANAPMFYVTGGGLGGNAGAADPPSSWGTASVRFPDCNTMILSYASNPGLPAGVPVGSGTRTWTRVGTPNVLACE